MNLKNSIFTFLVFCSLMLFSCNSENEVNKQEINDTIISPKLKVDSIKKIEVTVDTNEVQSAKNNVEKKENKEVFKFICPLGDKEGNSNKKGTCPICEMELIENPDYTK